MRRWIKLSAEAQDAAKWPAKRGFDGSKGTPLPFGLSAAALTEINANVSRFKMAVHMALIF